MIQPKETSWTYRGRRHGTKELVGHLPQWSGSDELAVTKTYTCRYRVYFLCLRIPQHKGWLLLDVFVFSTYGWDPPVSHHSLHTMTLHNTWGWHRRLKLRRGHRPRPWIVVSSITRFSNFLVSSKKKGLIQKKKSSLCGFTRDRTDLSFWSPQDGHNDVSEYFG